MSLPSTIAAPCADPSDWTECTRVARNYGRSFYLASRFLPPDRRRAVHAVYAYCRTADDIVDRSPCIDEAGRGLDAWRAQLDCPSVPVARAFVETMDRYGVPRQPVVELLDGVRRDLEPVQIQDWPDLRDYCHAVAGTVGLMVAPVLGCTDERALDGAATLGIAMQLTNILRDVAEDAAMGRLYLPASELLAHGCDPSSVLAGRPTGAFDEFMRFQIARARGLYAEARRAIPYLPLPSRFTTLAASEFYSRILGEIEALNFDVFATRATVSSSRKVRSLPGITASLVQMSLRQPVQP